MSVVESKACCVSDAQYMRLQGTMEIIEDTSPEDVIALLRKCVTMLGNDLQSGELVFLDAMTYKDLGMAAAARHKTEADRPIGA